MAASEAAPASEHVVEASRKPADSAPVAVRQPALAVASPKAPPSGGAPAYRLGSGDDVRIAVFAQPDLSGVFSVGVDGFISFPLIGSIDASGKSLSELATDIAAELRAGFVAKPSVTAEIAKYRPFYVLGEVRDPGAYPFAPGMTALKAVASAGGFSYRANQDKAFVIRTDEDGEKRIPVDNKTPLRPGDTLWVPERLF